LEARDRLRLFLALPDDAQRDAWSALRTRLELIDRGLL
jgi:hypothetical protein